MAENGADQPEAGAAAAQPQTQPVQPQIKVLGQFIRDMSFENAMMQRNTTAEVNPEVSVQVNLDVKKRTVADTYESGIKLTVTSKDKATAADLFLLELDYAGVFRITNVKEEQLHPVLLIECPRLIFPYVRRIVSDVTRDGGFPPLNLENIDFIQLYRQNLENRKAAQEKAAAEQKPADA
jgi:preprotein translocase subunit SecB